MLNCGKGVSVSVVVVAAALGLSTVFPVADAQAETPNGVQNSSQDHSRDHAIEQAQPPISESVALKGKTSTQAQQYTFKLRPGLTSREAILRLEAAPRLRGRIVDDVPEGALLAGRYSYGVKDSRRSVLLRMASALVNEVEGLWGERAPDLPFTTPLEAVVLASIVQAEAADPKEMPRIAGVFVNRLLKKMKLQADPTVIYAVSGGRRTLGRAIKASDLAFASPLNTYVIEGLPPQPIGNPSRAALQAVFHPEAHPYLFFVADGKGHHRFARTNAGHNTNVKSLRAYIQLKRRKGEIGAEIAKFDQAYRSFKQEQNADTLAKVSSLAGRLGALVKSFAISEANAAEAPVSSSRDNASSSLRAPAPSTLQSTPQASPQAAPLAALNRPSRDPFSPTFRLKKAAKNETQGFEFVPGAAVARKVPKMRLRGLIRIAGTKGKESTRVAALLEIIGSGVHIVRKGDTIGLHELGVNTVIKVVRVDSLSIVVEAGSLGQVIIVR